MTLNQQCVGRSYPASASFEVGREHIAAFAAAINDDHPAYCDVEAARALGHPDVIAPPTYLTVLMFRFADDGPVADPDLGLDYSLVVHGDQSFTLHRPVRAGDVLAAVTTVESIRSAGRNEVMTTVTEVSAAGDGPVATVRSTLVSRGTAPPRAT